MKCHFLAHACVLKYTCAYGLVCLLMGIRIMASQISMFDASAKLESLLHLAQSKPEFFTINVLPSNQDLDNRTIDGLKKLLVNPLNIVSIGFSVDDWNTNEVLVFGLRKYKSSVVDGTQLAYTEYTQDELVQYAERLFTSNCKLTNCLNSFLEKLAKVL